MEQHSLEKECNIKILWVQGCCPAPSTAPGSCSGFNSCNALSAPHMEAFPLRRGLFREYFNGLFYKKPSDSVVDVCKSGAAPKVERDEAGEGNQGVASTGASGGSERPNQDFILPARVSTSAPLQHCTGFLSLTALCL